jgi:hypothetical protein
MKTLQSQGFTIAGVVSIPYAKQKNTTRLITEYISSITPQQTPSILPLVTHNGEIHITRNGYTEIFRARTVKNIRIVERRLGAKWNTFGKLENGQVILSNWRQKDRESVARANLLNYPQKYLQKVVYNFVGKCRRCNRPLTDPVSAAAGIGPICAEKEIANAARLAGVRTITPTPPTPAPVVPTFTFAELAHRLSDDELVEAYKKAVVHHNTITDDASNSDELCAQTERTTKLIWEQMSWRPSLRRYYQSAEINHENLEATLTGKEKAAYKAATGALYRAPEGDWIVDSESSNNFHCITPAGEHCSCNGFRYHGKCWHLESVAILRHATLKVTKTIESGGQKALENLVKQARQQAKEVSTYQAFCYQVLINLSSTLYNPLAGDFSQQRV